MSDDFEDLERKLREAHSFTPRAGLREEVRARLRPGRAVPWAGLSAAAAVLLAVVGVGVLLHSAPLRQGAGGTGAASAPNRAATEEVPGFGRLPAPASGLKVESGAPASQGAYAAPPVPLSAPVYRWTGTSPPASCPEPVNPTLGGYPVVGPTGCRLGRPLQAVVYRLRPAPAGASLVYVAVPDGATGYFEPAYLLPDGTLEPALTPDELRP